MDLQISLFLLFILFTAGHSLKCYECNGLEGSCANQTELTCPSGSTHCQSLTGVTHFGDITYKEKYKECVPGCQSGSINFGIIRMTISCCNTDLCNLQDAPDPSNVTNGKTCYYCDGLTCSHTLSCSGDEDRCITAKVTSGDQTVELKGCVSKSFCGAATSVRNVRSTTCCEGNMCNGPQSVTQSSTYNTVTQTSAYSGAQSVSQSFLFLCCSLLSYFLLH